jgi:putative addiction module component (TIGR02574 family)
MKDLSEIRLLPVPERLELVAEIWDTIIEESSELPVSRELASELERRLEEHRTNPESSRPWSEVRKEIFGAD